MSSFARESVTRSRLRAASLSLRARACTSQRGQPHPLSLSVPLYLLSGSTLNPFSLSSSPRRHGCVSRRNGKSVSRVRRFMKVDVYARLREGDRTWKSSSLRFSLIRAFIRFFLSSFCSTFSVSSVPLRTYVRARTDTHVRTHIRR